MDPEREYEIVGIVLIFVPIVILIIAAIWIG